MNSSSNHRLRNFLLYSLSILMVLLFADLSIAKQVSFEREYTYQASEYDSKVSCRVNALEQVKRLLLEELGTYLESRTEVRDFKLTKDQIITLTAGIVRTEIVKETWDGKTYVLKARIVADPDEVIKSVDSLRKDHQKTKELEETRRKAAEYLKEMERLKSELALSKGDTKKQGQYNEAVNRLSATDWFEKGLAFITAEKYQDAIFAINRAIELDPKNVEAYFGRGCAYDKLGNFNQAIVDCTRAIELATKLPLSPEFPNKVALLYWGRGMVYKKSGNYNQAIADFTRAIGLDPSSQVAFVYYKYRGDAYYGLGNHHQAIADYNTAIVIYPIAETYVVRGMVYKNSGNYNQAIADFTKAIELAPKYVEAYFGRGDAYYGLGNHQQAIADLTKGIELKPKYVEAYVVRGMVYKNSGNYNQAIADFTRAIELAPKCVDAYVGRMLAYHKSGKLVEALVDYGTAVRLGFKPAKD